MGKMADACLQRPAIRGIVSTKLWPGPASVTMVAAIIYGTDDDSGRFPRCEALRKALFPTGVRPEEEFSACEK